MRSYRWSRNAATANNSRKQLWFPKNPITGEGWKLPKENRSFCEDTLDTDDDNMTTDCLKNNLYTFKETVLYANGQYWNGPRLTVGGVVHLVKPFKESIDPHKNARFLLSLNPDLSYFVGIADHNFLMASTNPSAVPYTLRRVGLNSGIHTFYLKVK